MIRRFVSLATVAATLAVSTIALADGSAEGSASAGSAASTAPESVSARATTTSGEIAQAVSGDVKGDVGTATPVAADASKGDRERATLAADALRADDSMSTGDGTALKRDGTSASKDETTSKDETSMTSKDETSTMSKGETSKRFDLAAVPSPTLSLPSSSSGVASDGAVADRAEGATSFTNGPAAERFRVGALVGVGFPRPFAVEGFVKIDRLVGVGVEYSFLPRMTVLGADTTFKAVAVDARLFPFRNAFFVGFRGGRQWLDATTTVDGGRLGTSNEVMNAATWFINPRIGFLHTMQSGITVGVDAGIQIPISPSFSRSGQLADAGLSGDVDAKLATVANTLGNKTTPSIDLLRIGFLF